MAAAANADGWFRVFLGSVGFAFAFFGIERLIDAQYPIGSAWPLLVLGIIT